MIEFLDTTRFPANGSASAEMLSNNGRRKNLLTAFDPSP